MCDGQGQYTVRREDTGQRDDSRPRWRGLLEISFIFLHFLNFTFVFINLKTDIVYITGQIIGQAKDKNKNLIKN